MTRAKRKEERKVRIVRSLTMGIVLLAVVALLAVPMLGKVIDNSEPPGHAVAPGLAGRAEFAVHVVEAGNSGNTILTDPIHICGSGRGG